MPFVFIIIGIIAVTAGVRGTSQKLVTLAEGDLKGQNSFIYWILAIGIIGALGYVQDLRAFSRALLALVIIVLVIRDTNSQGSGGLFANFEAAIKQISGG